VDCGLVSSSVVIADDHAGFRAGAGAFLEVEGYRMVGEAADGAETVGAVRRLRLRDRQPATTPAAP
jgi:DNA-binding NarL/FixJ family response regulator